MQTSNNFISGFDNKSLDEKLNFKPRSIYSVKNNPVCGITFYQWIYFMKDFIFDIDICYFPRFLFITLVSIFNSFLSMIESYYYRDNLINSIQLPNNPVFIIGHPRTGTTLMHNLLSSDQQNFYVCSTFCAGFPNCLLWFETLGKVLFSGVIEKHRPMDSVELNFDLPQEDECATNVLSMGKSYIMPLWFMCQETKFRKYLDFSREDGGTDEDEQIWVKEFLFLLKKLTLREYKNNGTLFKWDYSKRKTIINKYNNLVNSINQSNIKLHSSSSNDKQGVSMKRLLLKSPIHAARIPLLKQLFPYAKFVYLHRSPYEVFQSEAHMVNTQYWYCYMNIPTYDQIINFIFWQFEHMWIKYKSAKQKYWNDIYELSYADLMNKNNNLKHIKDIYKFLDIEFNDNTENLYIKQLSLMDEYKVNKHVQLPTQIREKIQSEWKDYIQYYKYE